MGYNTTTWLMNLPNHFSISEVHSPQWLILGTIRFLALIFNKPLLDSMKTTHEVFLGQILINDRLLALILEDFSNMCDACGFLIGTTMLGPKVTKIPMQSPCERHVKTYR